MAAVDLLAMWTGRYTSAATLIWVDSAQGNDSNPGTQASPKQSLQGAFNVANAGSRIRLRPGQYSGANLSGKNGSANNWIQVYLEPGARINASGSGTGAVYVTNCSFIAFYGGEMVGINSVGSPYELGFYMDGGAHSFALWAMTIHNMAGHAFAAQGGSRFDVCYNRMYDLAKWNEYQASAISAISMPALGSEWSDHYHNHIIGNVIDAVWTEESRVGSITDGNGVILDYSGGYPYRTLMLHNLIVGTGGRGLHALGTDHCDAYFNTVVDTCLNLAGTWIGAYSITDCNDCHYGWNIQVAKPGSNRSGIFQNAGSSTWSDTVFVRGTGGSEGNDPGVNQYNNVNKTATGPSGYFQQFQAGVLKGHSITNIAGYRPVAAQVATGTPPQAIRDLANYWPDALGFARPTTGPIAYGAFDADTSGGGGGGGPPPPPPPPPPPGSTGTVTVEAESGTVGGSASISGDFAGYLGTGYVGYFGNTGDFNQVSVNVAAAATYHFRIRYGNATSGGGSTQVRVLVNGVQAAIVDLPSTSTDWSDTTRFAWSTQVDIALASGANAIRIEHTGAEFSYADLDQYSFEPASSGGSGGGGGGTAQAPVAAFAFSPTSPNVNQSVSFVDQSTNVPTSWAWNFGDGTTSTARNPIKAYAATGAFTVTLTATNAQGSNTVTHSLTVVSVSGTAVTVQHQVTGNPLVNSTAYHVTVEVRDTQGLTNFDTEDFSTSWTAATAPTFGVNVAGYQDLGYVDVTFTNASKDADWVAWRVYRRITTGPGPWELVGETRINQANYSIKDYLARSYVQYHYTVVQVSSRSGGEVESNYVASSAVTPSSTDYWLIVKDDPTYNIRLWHVIADSFRDEVQSQEHQLIGRGRKVDIGTAMGYAGTLRFEVRDMGGQASRAQRLALEDLQRQTVFDVYLRNPFGDVFQVQTPSISVERVAGVGINEYVDCELEYREVS